MIWRVSMGGLVMNLEWMDDARKIPDEVMDFIRKIAVRAINEKDFSPESIAEIFGISRTAIYAWLKRHKEGGYAGLDTKKAPGSPGIITSEMDAWLVDTVTHHVPSEFGYDTVLWTREILSEILNEVFDLNVAASTVGQHLRNLGLSYKKPWFRAAERDAQQVERFLRETFPRIQRLADKIGADIGFEDEAGIGLQTHSGKTWGEVGETTIVPVTAKRGGFNMLSMVTAAGTMRFSIRDGKIGSDQYINFLKSLLKGRENPLILIVDRAKFHRSKKVIAYVRSNRTKIRIYFLPPYSPEMNPDEQVWNHVKSKRIEKKSVKTKSELKSKLNSVFRKLQCKVEAVKSFFRLPGTKYAAIGCADNC